MPGSPPQCSPHSGSSAKPEAVKSPKCQTPVGMEQLELFGLGRRKAVLSLMGIRSPPTRKPPWDFSKCEMSQTVVFLVLSGNLDFPYLHFAMPFWGVTLAQKWGKGCKELCLAGLGCAREICSSLCPDLTSSSCCLMRHCGSRVWM